MAASGGRDSTALLHATVRAARGSGLQVHALHVHHGLVAEADSWLTALQRQCRRWGVVLQWRRLRTRPAAGQSVEAWARRERYAALSEMAIDSGCTLVLLAHHRRDQAETWLLQALRGGGAAGLSAMPDERVRDGITWARPWLGCSHAAIDAYVMRHRLTPVEDSSNADPRFARNRLRLQVWPALGAAFPDAEASLCAAATQAQQAAALAAEVAASDLGPICTDDGRLKTAAWQALPPARRRNALSAWLGLRIDGGVPGRLLERLMVQLPAAAVARWPAPGGELRLYRELLAMHEGLATAAAPGPPVAAIPVDLSLAAETRLPGWHGRFRIERTAERGVGLSMLTPLIASPRRGGERFRLETHAVARSLKLQYQARSVPAWKRQGPLLYSAADRLLFVPGLGIDAAAWADPSQPQWRIEWLPDADDARSGQAACT